MKEERKVASGSAALMSLDAAQEAVAVAPAAHAGQQRARDVLQREVEVRHAGGEDGLDQLVGQPGGIEVEEPGALHPDRHGAGEMRQWATGRWRCGAPARPDRSRP
jgi:hypothetical protein